MEWAPMSLSLQQAPTASAYTGRTWLVRYHDRVRLALGDLAAVGIDKRKPDDESLAFLVAIRCKGRRREPSKMIEPGMCQTGR
jgi:hypothetical protein